MLMWHPAQLGLQQLRVSLGCSPRHLQLRWGSGSWACLGSCAPGVELTASAGACALPTFCFPGRPSAHRPTGTHSTDLCTGLSEGECHAHVSVAALSIKDPSSGRMETGLSLSAGPLGYQFLQQSIALSIPSWSPDAASRNETLS